MNNGNTAPVRPGEELDVQALEEYLRLKLSDLLPGDSPSADGIHLEQFPNGHSNLTYLLRVDQKEFVLRRPPLGPVAAKAHDMPREFRVLAAVHPFFPLAPRPYVLCEDLSVIGAPFYVMERRQGVIVRWEIPPAIGENLSARRRISEALVDTLVSLHQVNIYSTGLVALGKPVGFVTRQVLGWIERWHRSRTGEIPELDEVSRWLSERIPLEPDATLGRPATLVHNDFKLDNVVLDSQDPARVVGVLDWEMSTVGDPLVDLGLFLCYWVDKDDPEIRREAFGAVTAEPGWMTRAELIQRYTEETGRNVSAIAFYEIFALFKVAVAIQQIYLRYIQGQTRDERFKHFDSRVKGLARVAWDLAQQSGL